MKKIFIILVAIIGFGIAANAQNNLTAKVKTVEKREGGWSYINFEIKNSSQKIGWIGIKITWTDKSGKKQVYEKKRMAYNITANGKIEERFGVENYHCCAEVTVWFND